MALFEHMERLKLHFLAAFQKLTDKGVLSEGQLEEIIQIVDKLDDMSVEEIEAQLGRYIASVGDAVGDGHGDGDPSGNGAGGGHNGGGDDAAFA